MCAYLPNELLMEIVECVLEEQVDTRPRIRSGSDSKPPFSRIHAIVLSSRTLRAIGLRLWFSHLRVRNEWNWEYISGIPGIYGWVREISYHNVTSLLIPSIHPKKFPELRSVSIRMLNMDKPFGIIDRLPRSVNRLEIWKFDTMIHAHLFSAIASHLPDLRELRVHGMGEVDKYGVGTTFDSADALGRSIASTLGNIKTLRVLSMDIYLTPSVVLLQHAACPQGERLATCPTCIREFSEPTRLNEIEVSLRIASAVSSLERIEWCSCLRQPRKSTFHVARDRTGVVSVSCVEDRAVSVVAAST